MKSAVLPVLTICMLSNFVYFLSSVVVSFFKNITFTKTIGVSTTLAPAKALRFVEKLPARVSLA